MRHGEVELGVEHRTWGEAASAHRRLHKVGEDGTPSRATGLTLAGDDRLQIGKVLDGVQVECMLVTEEVEPLSSNWAYSITHTLCGALT